MSFTEFEKSIGSIALKDLASHWNDARGNRTMPAWSDLKPRHIVKALPIIWVYTYDVKTDAFTGRLAGERSAERRRWFDRATLGDAGRSAGRTSGQRVRL